MKVLAIMKSEHVEKLLSKFPWGIIFKFENELTNWQRNIDIVNKNSNSSTNLGAVLCSSSNIKVHQIAPMSKIPDHVLKVDEVLNSTTQGALILNYYEKYNKLNDGIRSTLVDILIGRVLSEKISMSVSLAESIANQIVTMFKSEVKVLFQLVIYYYCYLI